jgi:hypothetical protein
MKKYYFTFGCGQQHAGHYIIIEADTVEQARQQMFAKFGRKWSMCYTEQEWKVVEDQSRQIGYPLETELKMGVSRE